VICRAPVRDLSARPPAGLRKLANLVAARRFVGSGARLTIYSGALRSRHCHQRSPLREDSRKYGTGLVQVSMEPSRYSARPFRSDDYDVRSRVGTRLEPEEPITAEELRVWDRIYQDSALAKFDFIIEERASGAGVAYGSLHHVADMYHPHRYWVEVEVDPDHQHRGVGRALYERLEKIAQDRSAELLWASVRADDARSVQFFERTGFTVRRRRWVSRLSLNDAPTSPSSPRPKALPPEVTFTTLAEEGADRREVRERIYRLDLAASQDEPRLQTMTEISFEEYAKLMFEGPRYLPEAVFLARARDQYVAMTTLHQLPAEADTLMVGFTGTLPPYRGRGLASELKRRAVEFARARGYRYLRTHNDSENPRIWAINQKLGFQVQRVWMMGEKRLGRDPAAAPS